MQFAGFYTHTHTYTYTYIYIYIYILCALYDCIKLIIKEYICTHGHNINIIIILTCPTEHEQHTKNILHMI